MYKTHKRREHNMEAQVQYKIPYSFETVRNSLDSIEAVDGVTAGLSPVTVRWLTSKNKFVNVGLEEIAENECAVTQNNNSFGVDDTEVKEVYEGILGALKKDKP
jgi:hypothetical protein